MQRGGRRREKHRHARVSADIDARRGTEESEGGLGVGAARECARRRSVNPPPGSHSRRFRRTRSDARHVSASRRCRGRTGTSFVLSLDPENFTLMSAPFLAHMVSTGRPPSATTRAGPQGERAAVRASVASPWSRGRRSCGVGHHWVCATAVAARLGGPGRVRGAPWRRSSSPPARTRTSTPTMLHPARAGRGPERGARGLAGNARHPQPHEISQSPVQNRTSTSRQAAQAPQPAQRGGAHGR